METLSKEVLEKLEFPINMLKCCQIQHYNKKTEDEMNNAYDIIDSIISTYNLKQSTVFKYVEKQLTRA